MKKQTITVTFESNDKRAKKAYDKIWEMCMNSRHLFRVELKLETILDEVPTIPGDEGQPVQVPPLP